jgi:ATP-dependent RNA helicase RhlE
MTFKELEIIEPILRALQEKGYTQPTPIQEQSIPILLSGKDLLGCAQTGTGKTAAFSIPILQNIYLNTPSDHQSRRRRKPGLKALIVTPTRELAIQIGESLTDYGRFTGIRNTVIFGGVKQGAQTQALQRGTDILVATPGRLLDLISQGFISLREIEYFVLDEADRMLDMGFIHDVKKIINFLPAKRQSLFFSATMAPEIVKLSGKILGGNPGKVSITPKQNTAEKVDQSVYFVDKKSKSKLLVHLMEENPEDSTLVFSRTKHGADKIVKMLKKAGINALAIHGNKSQGARQKALGDFKSGETNVLVATDIAARGIDVSGLGRVINYDLPNIPETYVHRIGRTGRANAEGTALSFCDVEEKPYLKDIQKLINQNIPVVKGHPFMPQVEAEGEIITKVTDRPENERSRNSPKKSYSPNRHKKYGNNRRSGN